MKSLSAWTASACANKDLNQTLSILSAKLPKKVLARKMKTAPLEWYATKRNTFAKKAYCVIVIAPKLAQNQSVPQTLFAKMAIAT
jgi:hypothetical protein